EGVPEDGLPQVGGVIHSLIPRQFGHTLDVTVKEERPRVLGGVLRDLVREARVVPDEREAPVGVLFLPGAVEHLRLDLVVLSPRLTPSRMERLVEVLHEVRGLAHDEEHIPGVSSEPQHLLSVRRELLERVRRPAPGWWRRATERNDGKFVTHDSEEIGLFHARQQRRDVGGEYLPHLWWQDRQGIECDQAVAFESPGRCWTAPSHLAHHEEAKQQDGGTNAPHVR